VSEPVLARKEPALNEKAVLAVNLTFPESEIATAEGPTTVKLPTDVLALMVQVLSVLVLKRASSPALGTTPPCQFAAVFQLSSEPAPVQRIDAWAEEAKRSTSAPKNSVLARLKLFGIEGRSEQSMVVTES
jgi:hypothetical protein